MSLTIHVGDTFSAKLREFDGAGGTGTEVPLVGPVSFSSGDAAIVSIDASTGKGTGLAPGTATISASDGSNGLGATNTVTVIARPAVSAALDLATP
jgi:hypothetical protein